MLVLLLAGMAACGRADSNPAPIGPILRQVTILATPDGKIGPTSAVFSLDEEFAVLDGTSGCHRLLGSFTLEDQTQRASFTVPGVSTNPCEPAEQMLEDLILEALAEVTRFQRSGLQLDLLDSSENLLVRLEPIA